MEFNVLDIKDNLVPELKRFHRSTIDIENISSAASDLRYMTAIKQLLATQVVEPDENFLAYIIKEVYTGRKTAQVMDKFKNIVKRAFTQYINDVMNEKFKSVLEPQKEQEAVKEPEEAAEPEKENSVITTNEEMASFVVVKTLLHDCVDVSRLSYKDTRSYFGVVLDGKVTKWICRLQLDGKKKFVIIPSASGEDLRHYIDSSDDLFQYRNELKTRLETFLR